MFHEAQRTLGQFLRPLTLDEFLDRMLTGGFRKIDGGAGNERTGLLGADPESVLLGAWQLAPRLTFQSANPAGAAPGLQGVAGSADFQRRIAELHARNYSVHFPDLRGLSRPLDLLARALEELLHQPVTVSASWSRGGMCAPPQRDDRDLLVTQLRGTRRCYVSSQASALNNPWQSAAGDAAEPGPQQVVDLGPGDLMYLPRGTGHSGDADSGSLHVCIGFTPLTLREAVIAALDHLSDLDRGWRMSVGGRLAFQLRGPGFEQLLPAVVEASGNLATACRTPGFLVSALQWRSSRGIAALAALPMPSTVAAIGLDTELLQGELAFCHLTASAGRIDISYPGGHLYVDRAAQPCIEYMVNTTRFRVRDIPGEVSNELRLALAERFVQVGLLATA
jgi:hypothetical protein